MRRSTGAQGDAVSYLAAGSTGSVASVSVRTTLIIPFGSMYALDVRDVLDPMTSAVSVP